MDNFNRLLDKKHSLDRQLDGYIDMAKETLVQKMLTANSPEERGRILDEFDASLEPFGAMYKSLGEAMVRELNPPWWKFR